MSKIEETEFNFEDAVTDVMNGKSISGKDGILAPLVKQIVEAALQAELESHISQEIFSGKKNRKNGTSSKTIKSSDGEFKLDTPRDRAGTFEPQLGKRDHLNQYIPLCGWMLFIIKLKMQAGMKLKLCIQFLVWG